VHTNTNYDTTNGQLHNSQGSKSNNQNARVPKTPSQSNIPKTRQGQSNNQERTGGNRPQGGQNQNQNNANYDARQQKNSRRDRKKYQDGQTESQKNRTNANYNKRNSDPNVAWLRTQFQAYYSDDLLYKTLEQNNFDAERARQQLQVQKDNSWSNIVVRSSIPHGQYQQMVDHFPPPQPQPLTLEVPIHNQDQPHQENYQPRPKSQRRKNQNNAQLAPPDPIVPPKEEEYNADEKIQAIQSALASQITAMESKAEKLKKLHEDILKIQADRDVKIEHLSTEKERLAEMFEQLKQEIITKEQRISDIDVEVARLKQEKVQKIKALEEESRALLNNH